MPAATCSVAVPSPLYQLFDYRVPAAQSDDDWAPGVRVKVPFGKRQLIGVVLEVHQTTPETGHKLKEISERIDEKPVLPEELINLARWAAQYYHHPIGEVLGHILPARMRQGDQPQVPQAKFWRTTGKPCAQLGRAPRQQALLDYLNQHPEGLSEAAIKEAYSATILKGLADRGLIVADRRDVSPVPSAGDSSQHHQLNEDQQSCVDQVLLHADVFQPFVLEGVTGSGKTEVYIHIIEAVVARGKQALVLVPEINLTPQTVARFQQYLQCPIGLLHSGRNDTERLHAWEMARQHKLSVIIGTRSAIFTPLPALGCIVVDEEHDSSFKQQDGFRYSARDLALVRAKQNQCPVILGTATPSIETLHRLSAGQYQHLPLHNRAGSASPPTFRLLDTKSMPLEGGLSRPLINTIEQHLNDGRQVLVFINRRGYSPCLHCNTCGWIAECADCSSQLTMHRVPYQHLRCHHCEKAYPVFPACLACGGDDLVPLGAGTERTESTLRGRFPNVPVIRIDRDTTQRKEAMQEIIRQVKEGDPCILVGTQMLAKGHDFPGVTLACILDADGGLFSADFRAMEKTIQTILQVAGRAGRGEQPGEVVLQTRHGDHPLIQQLPAQRYRPLANSILHDREMSELPPFSHWCLIRADAPRFEAAQQQLTSIRDLCQRWIGERELPIECLGPINAPLEKRGGLFRLQLLVQSSDRSALNHLLGALCQLKQKVRELRQCRWSIDVDPQDMS